jgi:hypothetical protein
MNAIIILSISESILESSLNAYVIGAAFLLLGYLIYSPIKPEKF